MLQKIMFINSIVDDPVERLVTLASGNAEKEVNSMFTYVHETVTSTKSIKGDYVEFAKRNENSSVLGGIQTRGKSSNI